MRLYESLTIANFRNYLFGRFFSIFGVQMQSVVVGWQVYELTKDAFSLGLIGLAEIIPFLMTAFFAGNAADIFNRKHIIQIAQSVFLLCVIALWLLSGKLHYLIEHKNVYPIYAVIFVTGIARGFLAPAQSALMAQLVPKHLYGNSSTWNSVFWHFSSVIGPACGGFIYAKADASTVYSIVGLCILIGLGFFSLIESQPIPERIIGEKLTERLSAGLKFVFSNEIMLGALAMDMFAVLFGGAVALLPVFADEILHQGAVGLGWLRAAPAIGAVIMAGIMVYFPPLKNAGRNLLISVGIFGLCTILFAISTNFYLSFLLLALTGAFDNVSVVLRSTIVQMFTPDEMRGRVSAVNSIFIGSSNELGSFESGTAARLLGLIPSVIFGGVMTCLVVMTAAKVSPKLRKLQL